MIALLKMFEVIDPSEVCLIKPRKKHYVGPKADLALNFAVYRLFCSWWCLETHRLLVRSSISPVSQGPALLS